MWAQEEMHHIPQPKIKPEIPLGTNQHFPPIGKVRSPPNIYNCQQGWESRRGGWGVALPPFKKEGKKFSHIEQLANKIVYYLYIQNSGFS